jgi:type IV pilus assembly protein PilM
MKKSPADFKKIFDVFKRLKPAKNNVKTDFSACGFDIGTSTIKAAVLRHTKDNVAISAFVRKDIGGASKEQIAKTILPEIFAALNYQPKIPLNICVGGPAVVTRVIKMPKMAPAELRQALHYEADKHIPFDVKEVTMDFSVLSEEQDKVNVLLVAAKKDMIEEKIAVFEQLNYTVNIVDAEATALANLFLYCAGAQETLKEAKATALIDLGGRVSNLVVLKNLDFTFSRDIGLGGWNFIDALVQDLSLSERDATERFMQKDFAIAGSERLQAVLQNFINQIKISFDYCENQYGIAVDKVFLSGGLSKSAPVIEFLTQKLGYELNHLSLKDVFTFPESIKDENDLIDCNIAIGLALREK